MGLRPWHSEVLGATQDFSCQLFSDGLSRTYMSAARHGSLSLYAIFDACDCLIVIAESAKHLMRSFSRVAFENINPLPLWREGLS